MKQRRFTEEQISTILKSVEDGQKVVDVCRTHAVSEATSYRWKSMDGGLEGSQVQRLRHLEEENRNVSSRMRQMTIRNSVSAAPGRPPAAPRSAAG